MAAAEREGPPEVPGYCSTCGYAAHLEGELCAMWPCIRCQHRAVPGQFGPRGWKMRNDRSRGYLPFEYLACGCTCHRHWRVAYEAVMDEPVAPTVESTAKAVAIETTVAKSDDLTDRDKNWR